MTASMDNKRALITGINGQDGSYLAEYLLDLGYHVFGTIRRNSMPEHQTSRLDNCFKRLHLEYADMTDLSSVINVVRWSDPHEIYHLAAQSHVYVSYRMPQYTSQVNAGGTSNILEAAKLICGPTHVKIYNAATSEMFGNNCNSDGRQNENTPMHPVSPYGCSKVQAFNLCRNYRNAYGMFISNGILFNHESPRRGIDFVTTKIVKGAVECMLKKREHIYLGNLQARRDWGHAKDYVRAMHMMLQHKIPDDFVVATGESRSVLDLAQYVFGELGMDSADHICIDSVYTRPEELDRLQGNPSKILKQLGWKPQYSFESMIKEMIAYWTERLTHE